VRERLGKRSTLQDLARQRGVLQPRFREEGGSGQEWLSETPNVLYGRFSCSIWSKVEKMIHYQAVVNARVTTNLNEMREMFASISRSVICGRVSHAVL
jgi:hypothetical protein